LARISVRTPVISTENISGFPQILRRSSPPHCRSSHALQRHRKPGPTHFVFWPGAQERFCGQAKPPMQYVPVSLTKRKRKLVDGERRGQTDVTVQCAAHLLHCVGEVTALSAHRPVGWLSGPLQANLQLTVNTFLAITVHAGSATSVLTIVCDTQTFRKLHLFPSSDEEKETCSGPVIQVSSF
jgi:hypothetical protein